MIRSPFKIQKHKRFDYSPRFYNERKESIEQSRKYYNKNGDQESHQVDFTGTFGDMRKQRRGYSEKMPLIILLMLVACVFAYARQGTELYLYIAAICFPAYILLRLKSKTATHRRPLNFREEPKPEEDTH